MHMWLIDGANDVLEFLSTDLLSKWSWTKISNGHGVSHFMRPVHDSKGYCAVHSKHLLNCTVLRQTYASSHNPVVCVLSRPWQFNLLLWQVLALSCSQWNRLTNIWCHNANVVWSYSWHFACLQMPDQFCSLIPWQEWSILTALPCPYQQLDIGQP